MALIYFVLFLLACLLLVASAFGVGNRSVSLSKLALALFVLVFVIQEAIQL